VEPQRDSRTPNTTQAHGIRFVFKAGKTELTNATNYVFSELIVKQVNFTRSIANSPQRHHNRNTH